MLRTFFRGSGLSNWFYVPESHWCPLVWLYRSLTRGCCAQSFSSPPSRVGPTPSIDYETPGETSSDLWTTPGEQRPSSLGRTDPTIQSPNTSLYSTPHFRLTDCTTGIPFPTEGLSSPGRLVWGIVWVSGVTVPSPTVSTSFKREILFCLVYFGCRYRRGTLYPMFRIGRTQNCRWYRN